MENEEGENIKIPELSYCLRGEMTVPGEWRGRCRCFLFPLVSKLISEPLFSEVSENGMVVVEEFRKGTENRFT